VHDVASKLVVEGAEREHDDTTIARAVRHAFGWNTAVPAERIDIIVRRGIVTMRGSVDHWYQRKAAEATVMAVPGAVSVDDQIQLLAACASRAGSSPWSVRSDRDGCATRSRPWPGDR